MRAGLMIATVMLMTGCAGGQYVVKHDGERYRVLACPEDGHPGQFLAVAAWEAAIAQEPLSISGDEAKAVAAALHQAGLVHAGKVLLLDKERGFEEGRWVPARQVQFRVERPGLVLETLHVNRPIRLRVAYTPPETRTQERTWTYTFSDATVFEKEPEAAPTVESEEVHGTVRSTGPSH